MSVGDKLNTKHSTRWDDLEEAEGWCKSEGLSFFNKTENSFTAGMFHCSDRDVNLLLMYETGLTKKGKLRVYLTEFSWIKDGVEIAKVDNINEND